ncbi:putative 2-(R)-hydroxypropyl-CoM dehydrogenase [Cercophora scortea]|uniref:2-(R)-hydroxypropyl-CoM dehydrogenase n=1 Tax=Cercophora scortea TaxID=314031 RepID=A0AAE0IWD3_9PEZI|nr:putative 2-(R)-hydroxypropyl-CoM dehydrogenase [Cercophora scortea]
MTLRVQNKVCIVTGASSGLGRAIALALAREGAAFVLCGDLRADAPAAGPDNPLVRVESDGAGVPTHELIAKRHGENKAAFCKVDVTVEGEVEGMLACVVGKAGRVDVLVNNAGYAQRGMPLHEIPDQVWAASYDVNVRGPFLCSKHAIRQFLAQEQQGSSKRGCIINIASTLGLREMGRCAAYCTSKAALVSLTKVTALEYGHAKIQCNAICPGVIATAMTTSLLQNDATVSFFNAAVPWEGEVGVSKGPKEIANAAIWLASEETGWVTGVALPVDGGFAIHA